MPDGTITYRKIFLFWLPLAATWLMMSFEGPFIASIIARLADAKYNLAAYGVAFSFALIIEAPIIMIMSASTAIVEDKASYFKLKHFTYTLNGIITIIMLLCLIPDVFYFISRNLIGLPENIAHLTYISTVILIPWPAAIGYRRFYQGILIRNNLTRKVAYGTIVRLSSMSLTGLILYFFFHLPGAYVGASALSAGVVMEAIASKIMAASTVEKVLKRDSKRRLTYLYITKFYYPLAMSSLLFLGIQPMITFFMAHSKYPVESLAVLPVINSLSFIFRSFGVSYQEVGVALIGQDNEGYIPLKKFAITLGLILTGAFSLLAYTPASSWWFYNVSGLSSELTNFAVLPLQILFPIPALTVIISLLRAVIVNSKKTSPVTIGTAIEAGSLLIALFITINYSSLPGASCASIAFLTGTIATSIYLSIASFLILREGNYNLASATG